MRTMLPTSSKFNYVLIDISKTIASRKNTSKKKYVITKNVFEIDKMIERCEVLNGS